MATPMVLLQRGVNNETQDLGMTTVKLTANASSNFQTRFQIPKSGHILDSNSVLVWTVSWAGYDATKPAQVVALKNFSGGLNTILRARFYVGGKMLFENQDVGHIVHIKNLANNPDYLEEMVDMEMGSVHGFYDAADGKIQLGMDTAGSGSATGAVNGTDSQGIKKSYNRYARPLGSYSNTPSENKGIECSLMLSEIFSALATLQIPSTLDNMRLEIDWQTDFDEVAYKARFLNAEPITNTQINIENPVLLLDFLNFPEEARMGLAQVMQDGLALPFIHTSLSEKIIQENNTATSQTTDIQIALQGKLLMKIYVSHRLNNTSTATPLVSLAPQIGNGRCRSQRGRNMSYNLFVNDLSIHDLPVDSDSMQYNFFSITQQKPASILPGQQAYNDLAAPIAATDTNSDQYVFSGITLPTTVAASTSLTALDVRNMVSGTQSYIGFDLSKYQSGSGASKGVVIPADAGYRVGSSAVVLRITQTGSATADSQEARPKTVQIFTEEVRVLQVFGGIADVVEA